LPSTKKRSMGDQGGFSRTGVFMNGFRGPIASEEDRERERERTQGRCGDLR
jgi:hypothetical protein